MKSSQLREQMALDKNTRYIYGKVLALDELAYFPKLMHQSYIILNNKPHYLSGEHWLAIYIPPNEQKKPVEFFDSFGKSPMFYNESIVNFLESQRPKYAYNTLSVQPQNSILCGLFCTYFISLRCMGVPFNVIMQSFNQSNLLKNEDIVTKYFTKN